MLEIGANKLKSLDISDFPSLAGFSAGDNDLTILNLSMSKEQGSKFEAYNYRKGKGIFGMLTNDWDQLRDLWDELYTDYRIQALVGKQYEMDNRGDD